LQKRIFINNQIRASKVRVIDSDGKQMGVFDLNEAIQKAKEKNLDLIQITDKVEPAICKILNYGKYIYQVQKKERQNKSKKSGELKSLRLTLKISEHDLETRAKIAGNFLKKNYKVRIEMLLKGREKKFFDFAKGKVEKFLEYLKQSSLFKIEKELKKETKGWTVIIAKL
jgi:translation initiation factor IF-3